MVECKALHRQSGDNATEIEVISFNPGLTCEEASCETAGMCIFGQRIYNEGEGIELGCQKCVCKSFGQISCEYVCAVRFDWQLICLSTLE